MLDLGGIGKRVKHLREAAGWNRKTLAFLVGCSFSTIGKLEAGKIKDPSCSLIYRIAKAFNVTMESLLEEGL